jgi:hypothetical protein
VDLIQKVPAAIEPLRDGRLCLSTIVEAARVVTAENCESVLRRFFHRSKREAMEVVAALSPDPAPPSRMVVTTLATSASGEADAADASEAIRTPPTRGWPDEPPPCQSAGPPPAASPRADVVPLTADLRRLHMTVSRRLLEKLDAAKAALSHTHPGASPDEILEAGLDLLLARAAKRRGLVEKPRDAKGAPESKGDRIPAHVRRTVWKRDGGRCQWPLDSGGICGSSERLELDHVIPRARGGASTIANVRLLCRFHNDLSARRAYGDDWMDRFTRRGEARALTGARGSSSP